MFEQEIEIKCLLKSLRVLLSQINEFSFILLSIRNQNLLISPNHKTLILKKLLLKSNVVLLSKKLRHIDRIYFKVDTLLP